LRFKLSFRDLVEMMAERGIDLAHTTIMRWIQRYVPEFEKGIIYLTPLPFQPIKKVWKASEINEQIDHINL
jgi:hypothetical protein